jgi:hypothetical protein
VRCAATREPMTAAETAVPRDPFAPIEAFFPPSLQIILFAYLGIVLMEWAIEKMAERSGFLLFLIYLAAAVFFTTRAVLLLMDHL